MRSVECDGYGRNAYRTYVHKDYEVNIITHNATTKVDEERRANTLYSFVEDCTGTDRSKWVHVDILHPTGGALPDAVDWRVVCSAP